MKGETIERHFEDRKAKTAIPNVTYSREEPFGQIG